jgi:hypothetical protein
LLLFIYRSFHRWTTIRDLFPAFLEGDFFHQRGVGGKLPIKAILHGVPTSTVSFVSGSLFKRKTLRTR